MSSSTLTAERWRGQSIFWRIFGASVASSLSLRSRQARMSRAE
jgi:hypothetical protein